MMAPTEETSSLPVDHVIARIRGIYRSWTRETPTTQMRSDWDAAFSDCTVPVISKAVSAHGVDAEWIIPSEASQDKTILYLHGGGFRLGSVTSHRDLIARIASASGCRSLAINYRLAPEHRFPAPIEDTLAAYHWLQGQGFKPANIALVGDSAGGNLALAAMLSLRKRGLPLPVAAALMSPWTDLTASGESYASRATADPIHQRKMVLALAKNYLGEDGDPCDPLASPLLANLAGLPCLMIQVGDRETLWDDSIQLAEKARAAGVEVDLQNWDGMIHVFQMFSELAETRLAIASLSQFLRKHLRIQTGSTPL